MYDMRMPPPPPRWLGILMANTILVAVFGRAAALQLGYK